MKRIVVAAVMMVLGASAAQADWEWTKWGMTPDEVVAASNGTASIVAADPNKSMMGWERDAVGTWSQYDFTFEAAFHFDGATKGLMGVALDLPDAKQCGALREKLIAAYGEPTKIQENERMAALDWTVAGDAVKLSDVKLIDVCRITFNKPM